jgi:hypothetical protein
MEEIAMAASKKNGCLGLVASAVLSGIVVPVVVNVASQELQKADLLSLADAWTRATSTTPAVPPAEPPEAIFRVVAQGEGATPEEALQDALRHALGSGSDARRQAPARVASCKELACGIERRFGRNVYRRQVEAVIARRAEEEGGKAPANVSGWSWSFAGR